MMKKNIPIGVAITEEEMASNAVASFRECVIAAGWKLGQAAAPLPEQILQARQKAGLTQTEAAALIHKKLRSWQQWEAGDRVMDPALFELFTIKSTGEPT
jgi:putative transcriptional regulator